MRLTNARTIWAISYKPKNCILHERSLEKEEFEKSYHSFVDVQAIREVRKGIRYITKYLTKTKNESQTQNLTLALCWLFRKRSFAVSGDLYELLQEGLKKSGVGV